MYQITEWCHHFIELQVRPGDHCIDATMGNGHDTELLCRLVGPSGTVLAFDIQEEAIDAAKKLVEEEGAADQVTFFLDGHEHMDQYAEEETVSACLFNLGYLPGGDHSLGTKKETTIEAIEKGLRLLKKEGILCVCIYSGGDTGFDEKEAVLEYVKALPAKEYDVIACPFINKPNDPPMPVFIRKR